MCLLDSINLRVSLKKERCQVVDYVKEYIAKTSSSLQPIEAVASGSKGVPTCFFPTCTSGCMCDRGSMDCKWTQAGVEEGRGERERETGETCKLGDAKCY